MRIDLTKTPQVIFFIVVLTAMSIGLSFGSSYLFRLISGWQYSYLVDGFGLVGAYALLFSFFDQHAWRWSIFRNLGVVDFPVLVGRWKGKINSSFKKTVLPAVLEITQTFSRICVCLYTETSGSESSMAEFKETVGGRIELHYQYHNEPDINATKTMHGHDGNVTLSFLNDGKTLSGSYYNTAQHDRGNTGTMEFKFESRKLLNRF